MSWQHRPHRRGALLVLSLRQSYLHQNPHFANGASLTSDLVLVNVGTNPVRTALYLYDKGGNLIAAESVVEVTGDLEVTADGSLTVRTEMEPLGNSRFRPTAGGGRERIGESNGRWPHWRGPAL